MTPYQFGSVAQALTEYSETAEVVSFSDAVSKLGLTEITSDAGNVVSIGKYLQTTAEATAEATTGTTAGGVGVTSLEVVDGTATASGAVVSDASAVIGLTPKSVVLMAACGALGLEVGLVGSQALLNEINGTDYPIEWNPFAAMGDIITYILPDGTTMFPLELLENIKNSLFNNGVFDDNFIVYPEPQTIEDFTQLHICDPKEMILKWCETVTPNVGLQAAVNTLLSYDLPSNGLFKFILVSYPRTENITAEILYSNPRVKGTLDLPACNLTLENSVNSSIINISARSTTGEIILNKKNDYTTSTFASNKPSTGTTLVNIGTLKNISVPKQPDITTWPDERPLPQTYPNWMPNGAPEIPTPTKEYPDGKTKVAPLSLPNPNPSLNPDSQQKPYPINQEDAQTGQNELEDVAPLTDTLPDFPEVTDPPVPPVDPIGDTPVIVPPTSGATTGMVHIYNPTLAQLSAFSSWLWTGNPFENFSKLFQDPIQAIIGLNLLYATPTRAQNNTNIVVGNVDSQLPSRYVTEQYIDIDCGSVLVNKYFNNVLDYINTEIQLSLPFIGIVNLSQKEIVGHTVSVKYKVDVLTGTCLALVYVGGQLLYTFSGNCAIQLPLTGANYMSIFSTLASVVGAGISGFTLGGVAGAIGGAIGSGVTHAASGGLSHQVQRSGNIGANAGAMGVKKPYLIITRNKPYNPSNYQRYYGFPANTTVKLGDCTGFTRVKDVILKDMITEDGTAATMEELNEIEALLKEGVYL